MLLERQYEWQMYKKKCLSSFVSREMQIETHFIKFKTNQ